MSHAVIERTSRLFQRTRRAFPSRPSAWRNIICYATTSEERRCYRVTDIPPAAAFTQITPPASFAAPAAQEPIITHRWQSDALPLRISAEVVAPTEPAYHASHVSSLNIRAMRPEQRLMR